MRKARVGPLRTQPPAEASGIYRLVNEARFAIGIHFRPSVVRWREAGIIAWQNRAGELDE